MEQNDKVLFVSLSDPTGKPSMGREFVFSSLRTLSGGDFDPQRLPMQGEEIKVRVGSVWTIHQCISAYGQGQHNVDGHSAVVYAKFISRG